MKSLILKLIDTTVSPLVGKGFIDKHFPFLISLYELVYYYLQPNGFKIVSIPLETKLKVPFKDTHVGMYLISKGVFEPLETKLLLEYTKSNDTVLDIGANFGYYTTLLSRTANEGVVYAFEPDIANNKLLNENINLNNLSNVITEKLAVSSEIGEVGFSSSKIHRGKSHVSSDDRFTYKVPVVTLDSYCANNKIKEINVMKIDVEGSEIPILRGAKDIISKSKRLTLFIEYNPGSYMSAGFSESDFFAALDSVGLHPLYIIDEARNSVMEYTKSNLDTLLRRTTYTNLLCQKV